MPPADPHVFALPPGVDFARELVRGLVHRMQDEPPEAMARVRLILNAGRMSRRVREEFDSLGTRFLPRIELISDLARLPMPGLPAPVPALRRKLELACLVDRLARGLPGFETGSGVFSLTDSLLALLAEMQSEGVHPEVFERLDIQASHAEHWRQSLAFIRIVARYFETELDTEGRQRRVVEMMARIWAENPTEDRIILAGSTGSRGATRLLMQAVAALPQGVLVLPGFDFDMPEMAWNSLCSGLIPIEDHPQYRFRALLDGLSLAPAQVARWTETLPESPKRNALVSLALRPAPVTDQWMREGQAFSDLPAACAQMTLIEAADPRQESLAIALVLREAVFRGKKAALISPDRMLTRRVAAALDRWSIVPDDSAGQPLPLTAPGRLIRHLARLLGRKISMESLLVILKHPLVATGSALRGAHLRLTREFELSLRRKGPAFPDAEAVRRWGGTEDPERQHWSDWLAALIDTVSGGGNQPISGWLETLFGLLDGFAAGPGGTVAASELWLGEAGQAAFRTLADLAAQDETGLEVSSANFADLIDTLLQEGQVRSTLAAHPLVTFLGTLEARAHGAEVVILAGLNEKSWPEAPSPDPWLSRKMRLDAGLLLPERQIGLSAHDFQQAIAAPEVVLSRARRDSEAETVPSRWLNRLLNLAGGLTAAQGPEALAQMRVRGQRFLDLASRLDLPLERVAPAPRPAPCPPAEARPRQLPVTAIKTLIRDPYAIYAARILRLRPLDPLKPGPNPRLRGEALHRIVELFVTGFDPKNSLDSSQKHLSDLAETVLQQMIPWPSTQRLWLHRLLRIAPQLVAQEAQRRAEATPAVIETSASIELGPPGFTLTARPDRIDLHDNGMALVYDYKSGTPPKEAEVRHFDKQLLLEAAMIERGAFAQIGLRQVAGMSYVHLGGSGECRMLALGREDVEQTWTRLQGLIARYLESSQGFTARRAMQLSRDIGDYDHLSRFGEWDITDLPVPEDVG